MVVGKRAGGKGGGFGGGESIGGGAVTARWRAREKKYSWFLTKAVAAANRAHYANRTHTHTQHSWHVQIRSWLCGGWAADEIG
jgi:hypothetical protein